MSVIIPNNYRPDLPYNSKVDKTYFIVRGWSLSKNDCENQNDTVVRKRGFYLNWETKHFTFYYPNEFIVPSPNEKFIIFQYCRCMVEGHITGEIEIHADFIPRDQYCNSLVYQCNLQCPDDNRKYKVTNVPITFDVWFTQPPYEDDFERKKEPIIPDDFVIYMKLVY